jgi:hypothetical protein
MGLTSYKKPPAHCDICSGGIENQFVDGATRRGPWGNMCPKCHQEHGVGLGTGRGQLYEKRDDGRFVKIKG